MAGLRCSAWHRPVEKQRQRPLYLRNPQLTAMAGWGRAALGVERQRHSDDWLRNAKAMLEDEAI